MSTSGSRSGSARARPPAHQQRKKPRKPGPQERRPREQAVARGEERLQHVRVVEAHEVGAVRRIRQQPHRRRARSRRASAAAHPRARRRRAAPRRRRAPATAGERRHAARSRSIAGSTSSTPFCQRRHMAKPSARPRSEDSPARCGPRARGPTARSRSAAPAAEAACDMVGWWTMYQCRKLPAHTSSTRREREPVAEVAAQQVVDRAAARRSRRGSCRAPSRSRARARSPRGRSRGRPRARGGPRPRPAAKNGAQASRGSDREDRAAQPGLRRHAQVLALDQLVVRVLVREVEVAVLQERAQRRRST